MVSYYLNKNGGTLEGHWYCKDEERKYYKNWSSILECAAWCERNEFKLVIF